MALSVDIRKSFGSFELEVAFEAGKETMGFLGASGCGKSLTLRSIAGIEKPDEGKIVVNDVVFFDKAPGKKATVDLTPQQRKTALLFQNYQLFPNLTVADNIAAGMDKNATKEEREAAIEEQLHRFGLVGKDKRYPLQLSGGQQQRVALARMLAAKPGILMLDEPFSALDSHMKAELEQNLIGLFNEFDGTILYISHDIDEAFRFCDRIAVVDEGHITEMGSKEDLLANPKSLAGIKLSGCKNTPEARYVDDHHVFIPAWGITVATEKVVPQDVKHVGIRSRFVKQGDGTDENDFRVRCDRVSDSRFERTVMGFFLDGTPEEQKHEIKHDNEHSMRFLRTHLNWRIDKLDNDWKPTEGEEVFVRLPKERIYLVNQ